MLELNDVSKHFGEKRVLEHLTMRVPSGEIYGFVGKNSAGKTTTMRLIVGLEELDSGSIAIDGAKQTPVSHRPFIGYLPDVPAFYDDMTPGEYLTLCGHVSGLRRSTVRQQSTTLLKKVGLPDDHRRIHGFSRGMKQRLGVAQALLGNPELLICDEPTSALDPSGRSEFLSLLASLRGEMTIIFSTHILNDVERIADRVGILAGGRLQAEGTLAELSARYARPTIRVQMASDELAQKVQSQFGAEATTMGSLAVIPFEGVPEIAMRETLRGLLAADLTPVAVVQQAATLEDVFLEVVR